MREDRTLLGCSWFNDKHSMLYVTNRGAITPRIAALGNAIIGFRVIDRV